MTRNEALAVIEATLPTLDEDRLTAVAELVQAWSAPTAYATLPPTEKANFDAALDRLDAGQSVPAGAVFARIASSLIR